jgi:hypothetical protein
MSDTEQFVGDITELHRAVHDQMRQEIADLDTPALNWTPGPDTSAIGTIITHALGAEAEMVRNLLDIPTHRDRDSEFTVPTHTREALDALLAAADADWANLGPRLDATALRTLRPRPNKPTPQSGLFWLVRNYGHMREHVGQIQLTKQLYQQAQQ